MEEKERYELFGEHCIKDNNPDARCQLLSAYMACVILNEQDKRIQELKDKIEFLTTFKEVISEHKPAFCKLAGRDCELLGKELKGEK